MRVAGKLIWPFIFALAFIALSRVFMFAASPAHAINLPAEPGSYSVENDDTPEVTARVARISFLKGDAQIRRADGGDWEKVTLNLPVVEGDEITTDGNARLEIQFDNTSHARLDENAYLKIVTLKDGGIALSLSLGTMAVRITRFDKNATFFEIDAPKTTVAVLTAGSYRIDAGQQNDNEIRVAVTENGEARIYSGDAGFTLRNDRSARVFVDGPNSGEWEAGDSASYSDEFDTWSLDRDATIAQRLKDAFYDKYYDNDIYGADDLNGYGNWVNTASYGYVWRPYSSVTSYYADWSPYRYGHWRWIPPYGWTWVNDEPWGWATYHHGRWFYDDGYWNWSPYGYYRYSRSWWSPALVVLNIFNNNVCWYPLPYGYAYYNYNHYYYTNHHGGHHNGWPHHPPLLTPQTGGIKPPHQPIKQAKIPPSSVVAMGLGDFGTMKKGVKTAPLSVANLVISRKVDDLTDPVLPTYTTAKISSEIKTGRPKADVIAAQMKVGAAARKANAPLDQELRTTRILGGRKPLVITNDTGEVKPVLVVPSDTSETRKTGAVERESTVQQTNTTPPIRPVPHDVPSENNTDGTKSAPVKATPTRQPPVRREPRSEPLPIRQPSRSVPTPTRQPPRSEPAPTRQPPVKNQPKQESKPPAKAASGGASKTQDG